MQDILAIGDILSNADFFLYDIVGITPSNCRSAEACFVKSSKEAYDHASFLKIGEFRHGDVTYRIKVKLLMKAMIASRQDGVVHHIFNTGFCCSTLLARALGALGPFLVLREPEVMDALNKLRTGLDLDDDKTVESWRSLLRTVLLLLGRTYTGMVCTIAKADEFSGRMQRDLLGADTRSKAVFLYSPLPEFLSTILKSPERRTQARAKLLLHEGDVDFLSPLSNRATLTDAEVATLGWLYEQYNYLRLISAFGDSRVKSVTAQEFLQVPARVLAWLAEWFGARITSQTVQAVAKGPIMRTHSKAQDQRFDAVARQKGLRSVSNTLEVEIQKGLDLAKAITRDHPLPAILPGSAAE